MWAMLGKLQEEKSERSGGDKWEACQRQVGNVDQVKDMWKTQWKTTGEHMGDGCETRQV
jgi:hypothetical protein